MPVEKTCLKCGRVQKMTEFVKDSESRDGHHRHCKVCLVQMSYKREEEAKARNAARRRYERQTDRNRGSGKRNMRIPG